MDMRTPDKIGTDEVLQGGGPPKNGDNPPPERLGKLQLHVRRKREMK